MIKHFQLLFTISISNSAVYIKRKIFSIQHLQLVRIHYRTCDCVFNIVRISYSSWFLGLPQGLFVTVYFNFTGTSSYLKWIFTTCFCYWLFTFWNCIVNSYNFSVLLFAIFQHSSNLCSIFGHYHSRKEQIPYAEYFTALHIG